MEAEVREKEKFEDTILPDFKMEERAMIQGMQIPLRAENCKEQIVP
jgi:hypothetical protein